jgi:hypothetical protein
MDDVKGWVILIIIASDRRERGNLYFFYEAASLRSQ